MKEGDEKSKPVDSGQQNPEPIFYYMLEDAPPVWKSFLDAAFWKQLFVSIFSGGGVLSFIPSLFSDPEELAALRAKARTRKMEAGAVSVFLHVVFILTALFFARGIKPPVVEQDEVVFINVPIFLPFDIEGDGMEGGGGGGGGKNDPEPPAMGELPETAPVQMIAPDPTNPQPLMAAEDLFAQVMSIEMPIQLPRNLSLPIGDITGPPNYSASSGPGSGGGIGTGTGTGIGSGTGSGVGPGSGGGMGGGSGGGIGTGKGTGITGSTRPPEVLSQPRPEYTEEARKARIEGIVILSVTVRRDGTIDQVKLVRGLGYGLDDSAISTVTTKWRFRPASQNGQPIDYPAVTIEVTFRLL